MKKGIRFFSMLVVFLLSTLIINGQSENISRTMGPNDSLTVNVKFEKVKLTKEETTVQEQINTLLVNSMKTTDMLASGIDRLTTALENNVQLSQLSKADIVAAQIGLTKEKFNRCYRKNNTILLFSLLPVLLVTMYSMWSFFMQKGVAIQHFIAGTAVMALYGLLGSGVLYVVLSLIFNKQYFVIKSLMTQMF